MKTHFLSCFAGLACGLAGWSWAADAASIAITSDDAKGSLEIQYGGQKLLTYAYAAGQFKPYVKELRPLKGDNVLLDSPADHVHHHGLMYAIKVNGHNFWEELIPNPGIQKPVRMLDQKSSSTVPGRTQAAFTQVIHWIAATNKEVADTAAVALLVEQRNLRVTVDDPNDEVAVRWQSDFTVGPAAPKVTLSGANYHGLGVRLPRAWDKVARHHNSENLPYRAEGNPEVIGTAKWSTVTHTVNGGDITLALFGDQRNPGGDPVFFSMLTPFTYLSATQGLDQKPREYVTGEKFRLRYLVTVYSAAKTIESMKLRYEKWQSDEYPR